MRPGQGRRVAALGLALLVLAAAGSWTVGAQHVPALPEDAALFDAMVAVALLVYVLAMATPFVPGIEIGLALMMVLGDEGIVLVYAATQAALLLSYALGRWVPARVVYAVFRWLGMQRAAGLLQAIEKVPADERTAYLARSVSGRWSRRLVRHHGWLIAALLNLPGNAVIGGGGGIGMIAGMSRAISPGRYLSIVAAATSPVPLFLLLR